jgi:hypothetical protein
MARPLDQHFSQGGLGYFPGYETVKNQIATAQGQLIALTRELQRICQTVHPDKSTLSVFGHDIRNLLMLACTEMEAHWRGVLVANGAAKADQRLNTNDYVKLSKVMKLPEFSVSFPFFPWLPSVRPFEHWGTTGEPTREIDWYAAYNQVKHDRESYFSRASLGNAFNAVTGCMIMMWAQFGNSNYFGLRSELGYFFRLEASPSWSPSDVYTFPHESHAVGWEAVSYNFAEDHGMENRS